MISPALDTLPCAWKKKLRMQQQIFCTIVHDSNVYLPQISPALDTVPCELKTKLDSEKNVSYSTVHYLRIHRPSFDDFSCH